MQYSQEHLKTMVYAEFGGQTECIMGNWKIENDQSFDHCSPGWRTTLPRKRRAPARLQVGVGAPELFPQTVKDHF